MKKFNLNEFIWFLCLTFIDLYLIYLLKTEGLYNYVHPKMFYYTVFAIILIGIICLFQLTRVFTIPSRQGVKKGYGIFFIAFILMMYGREVSGIEATEYKGVTLILNNQDIHEDKESHEKINETGIIKFDKEHFFCYFEELQENPKSYLGREVDISGFVYKVEKEKGLFYLGRSVLNCCVADSQNLALVFKADEANMPEKGQWLQVNGVINVNEVEYKGNKVALPTIKVKSTNRIPNDQNEFLYKEA